MKCEICGNPLTPKDAYRKVTGWLPPTGTTIQFPSAPFGFACHPCMVEKKLEKQLRNEPLF